MKIILIRPPFVGLETGPPIGLAYIQNELKCAGHDVSVRDLNLLVDNIRDADIDRDFKISETNPAVRSAYDRLDEFCADILAQEPDVVGFSLAHNTVDYGIAMAKRLSRHVRCIAGGPQASFNEKALLAHGCFAAVVSGYGEEAVIPALYSNGIFSAKLIPGKDYRPDYSGMDLADYDGFFPIVTTRGCPNSCFFCTQHFPYYFHTIESVLEQLKCTKNIRRIHFNDSNINVNTSRTEKLFSELGRLGPLPPSIVFGFEIRQQYQRYVAKMAACGVKEAFIGLESGSLRERHSMLKPTWTNALAVEVIRELTANKIMTWAQFIFCYPDQTENDRQQTLAFMHRLNAEADPNYIRFQWFRFVVHLGLEESFNRKYGVIATSPKNWQNHCYAPQSVEQLGHKYRELIPQNGRLYM